MNAEKNKMAQRKRPNQQQNTVEQINAQYGKLPPQAIDVEEAVLGALMLERDAYVTVADTIDSGSFYKEEHKKIFDAIKKLSGKEAEEYLDNEHNDVDKIKIIKKKKEKK